MAVLLWFCLRFYQRERAYSLTVSQHDSSFSLQDVQFFRVSGHIVDCAALMLLISPMVWEHHYVIALPLAVWAVAMQGSSRPWPVAIALILMFAIPTFDFFPFSYHRLVGLFILIIVASPRQILPSPARLAGLQQPQTP